MGADAHSKCGECIQLQTSAMHSCIKDMLKPALKHKATFNWQGDNLLFLFPHIHTYHLPLLRSHEYSLLETSPSLIVAKVYKPWFCCLLSEWTRATLSWKLTWFQDNTVSLCCIGSKLCWAWGCEDWDALSWAPWKRLEEKQAVLKWIKCWLYCQIWMARSMRNAMLTVQKPWKSRLLHCLH